jgi:hypothetical protein
MATKVVPERLAPKELSALAAAWCGVLKYALEHPALAADGRIAFAVSPGRPRVKAGLGLTLPPISRPGGDFFCPSPDGRVWDLEGLAKVAALLEDLTRAVQRQV